MPVRKRNGEPHKEGRKFYSDVISRRIELNLLEENVLEQAIDVHRQAFRAGGSYERGIA